MTKDQQSAMWLKVNALLTPEERIYMNSILGELHTQTAETIRLGEQANAGEDLITHARCVHASIQYLPQGFFSDGAYLRGQGN